jgi:hypothetical protein
MAIQNVIQGFDVLPSFHRALLLQNNYQSANSSSNGKWLDNFVLKLPVSGIKDDSAKNTTK